MIKRYNKKQKDAISSIVSDLDELDNKPRRLFNSLRKMAEAFKEEKKTDHYYQIIDSIDEFEDFYYQQISIPYLIRNILEKGRDTKRNLTGRKQLKIEEGWKTKEYQWGYKDGVIRGIKTLETKIIEEIIENNT